MSLLTSSDENIIIQILINFPKPRLFRDRSNLLEEYDDLDFKNIIINKYYYNIIYYVHVTISQIYCIISKNIYI